MLKYPVLSFVRYNSVKYIRKYILYLWQESQTQAGAEPTTQRYVVQSFNPRQRILVGFIRRSRGTRLEGRVERGLKVEWNEA